MDVKHVSFVPLAPQNRVIHNQDVIDDMISKGTPDTAKVHLVAKENTSFPEQFIIIDLFFPSFSMVDHSFARFGDTLINAHGQPYTSLRKYVPQSQLLTSLATVRTVVETQFTQPNANCQTSIAFSIFIAKF